MKPRVIPALFLTLLLAGAGCAHAPATGEAAVPVAAEALVDPALLRRAGLAQDEYVLEHHQIEFPLGFRDTLLLAKFPVEKRDGFCTTMVRNVGLYPAEDDKPAQSQGAYRAVFRAEAPGACDRQMKGEIFASDDGALPALQGALGLIAAGGFGEPALSPRCLGQFPEDYAADKARLVYVHSAPAGLRLLYRPESPTWTLTALVRLGPGGPVLDSTTLDCTHL